MTSSPPIAAAPDTRFEPGAKGTWLALAAVALGVGGFVHAYLGDHERAWGNVLMSNFYFLAIALGALLFVAIQYLAVAGWWVAVRRIPEAMSSALPWVAAPMLLLGVSGHSLYHWMHEDAVAHDALLQAKAPYLNAGFFFVRLVVILALWTFFALTMRRLSLREDRGELAAPRRALGRMSGVFVVLFAVSFSVASFDWLMSLEPHWFSTIFAVYTFAGLFQGAIAAMVLAVLLLRRELHEAGVLRSEHLHDLGKLLFAFSTFWAYIWLSQYLLIWYSNLPEETPYFITRTQGSWQLPFFLNLVVNWLIPFLVLLPQWTKRQPKILMTIAIVVLLGRWLDLFVHVMPALGYEGPRVGVPEVLVFVGFAGLFVFLVRRALAAAPLVPQRDPLLRESLTYPSS